MREGPAAGRGLPVLHMLPRTADGGARGGGCRQPLAATAPAASAAAAEA